MTENTNEEISAEEAFELLSKAADIILQNPESVNIENYEDVFSILEQVCSEDITTDFKDKTLKRLGLK